VDSPTLFQRWWQAIRPHSLRTALGPVLVGGCVALFTGSFRLWAFILALAGVALLLIGTNLLNDYFDFRNGADPPIGVGQRALQTHLLAPATFLRGGLAAVGLGGLLGLVLALNSPPAILGIGLVAALLGLFYTAPPLKLGYRGLGEVVVFSLLGPGATLGSYAVTANRFSLEPVVASLPIGFAVAAILHANNLRDFASDEASGKRTLAVQIGPCLAGLELDLLLWAAELSVIAAAVLLTPLAFLGLLTVLQVWRLTGRARPGLAEGRQLMRETATLHLRLSLLLAVGFAAASFLARR
jgi:1,4-dihydroxy-2-naphthoate polyprenyltransferase